MKNLKDGIFLRLSMILILCQFMISLTGCSYSFVAKSENLPREVLQTPTQTPIPLQITGDNEGKRCEFTQYNLPSENPYCYKLQEKLITSSEKGDLEGIKKALAMGANIDAGYYQSFSALFNASMLGQTEAIILLIENGANVNRVFTFGQTPLKAAVTYNHPQIVKILLEQGADVCEDSMDDDGQKKTALDIAQERGLGEIEKILTKKGITNCSQ